MTQSLSTFWLVFSNFAVSLAWARVVSLLLIHEATLLHEEFSVCSNVLVPALHSALAVSFVEVFNAAVGLTRSNPSQVLTFNAVRIGVTFLVAPKLPCNCWQALMTIACWSFGDTIRFACFGVDQLVGGRLAKSIRYTVAPLLFPFGALGEMLMVIRLGTTTAYVLSALWPVGFYPLMKQLLKQRQKHFNPPSKEKVIKSV